MNYQYLNSPIGTLRVLSDGQHITAIEWPEQHSDTAGQIEQSDAALAQCVEQLQEYFAGTRRSFDLPLAPGGTEFQNAVWAQLARIPFGELRSYGDIAREMGKPKAMRAVGAANGRNPIPIVVPCHRVIGSDGSLTGFAGGLDAKKTLLNLEGALD
ncbi:cysteine methyltransferase [Halioglobus japonicus]|uniref:Methylated-DNA--protein-cysteine methyltransferase n=1 Tax=Halioglobus japonicus TaxID=930805 RepID=A0AAP8SLM5_9GAMM|nr:methylated-DNA--[protein]-cysteine S-methyltransferase [Halioglobus japonicus]AQA20048.1 cysteine methyltransferase [Halioglobus japonicus]PLW84704.1 cysteine methyltransferase [Halioglobus japonicus]GHD20992.1 methylated-DNA--protein-cysteine methyltransferase [Halioglobus japonicus]